MLSPTELLQAKILIVDDQMTNVSLLEKFLSNIGYKNLISTLDPTHVCALHQQHHFDLILLDLNMPVMDGFQVMEALKEVEPDSYTPVLVITAQPSEKIRALQAGAKDFVSKPFELVELQTRIANMLEVRLLHKQLDHYNQHLEKTVAERTQQLKESEARFKSFTKLSSDWYWEQDADGNYVSFSGPVFAMLGIPASAQESKPSSIFEEWNQAEFAQLRNKIEARTPFLNYLYSLIQDNGNRIFLQVSGEPIFDQGGGFAGYRGIGMELNDSRRIESELQRLRSAFNYVEQAILIFEEPSLRLIDANQSACQLFDLNNNNNNNSNFNFDSDSNINNIGTINDTIHLHELGAAYFDDPSEAFLKLSAGIEQQHENRTLKNKEGAIFPVRIAWHRYQHHNQSYVVAIISMSDAISVFDGLD
jgi:PAS domain S-box-containing protein